MPNKIQHAAPLPAPRPLTEVPAPASLREARAAAAAQQQDFAIASPGDAGSTRFAAIDRFAVQSLCYQQEDGQLSVAARADTLAQASTPLDPQAILDYLYFHCIPSPRTIFQGVQRLPPAHLLWNEAQHTTVEPYWRPAFAEPHAKAEFAPLREEFLQLLEAAVARRLDGGTPACFLSGGTDSSTVAGMIKRATGQPAHTYSIGFEADGYDEMAFARVAAKHFGCVHHEYYVTPDDLVAAIPMVAASYDQPFGNSSALPAYYCARMARDQGVTRILAGDGGDELFGGNKRYAHQQMLGWYDGVPGGLRKGLLEPVLCGSPLGTLPVLRKGRSYIRQAQVPMPSRMQASNLLHELGLEQVLTADFLARLDTQAPERHQQAVWDAIPPASLLDRMLAYDWRYTLAESDLPKVRGTTALAGVSVAFPMLDDALLDFSMRLPPRYKLKNLKLRWFFKEALRGFLPDEILAKKKQGFGLPFGVWATQHAGLRKLAEDSLGSLGTRGLVRPEFVQTLLRKHLPAHPGYFGEMVWILMMLEQWLRHHRPNARF